jgi:parvulin-like peptidyl-prolyl isomerase
MSKRERSSRLPQEGSQKSTEPTTPAPGRQRPPSRREEYHSRAEREAQIQRYIILGTTIAVIAIVLILGITIFVDQVITPRQVVANVDGHEITVADFQKRVRLERLLRIQQLTNFVDTYRSFGFPDDQIQQALLQQPPYSTWYNELQIPDQMGLTVINDIVNEQLIRNEAAVMGISVTQEQIDAKMNDYFGYDPEAIAAAEATAESTAEATATVEPTFTPTPFVSPTPSPTPTTTPTPEFTPTATTTPVATLPPEPTLSSTQQAEQFQQNKADFFNNIRSQTGMSDGDINSYFEFLALRDALRDSLATDITNTGAFSDARHILVATEEEAQDIIAALNSGESFAELARSASTDTGSGANGGELGWSPVSNFVKPFADAVVAAEIGAIVGPVQTEFGYHIIQVRAREDRELTEEQVSQAKEAEFSTWLEELKTSKAATTQTFSNWVNYVPSDPASPFG